MDLFSDNPPGLPGLRVRVQRLVLKVQGTTDRRTRVQAAWVEGTLGQ
jgi:hypothetical protein